MIDICNKKIPCCGCPDADTCTKKKQQDLFKEFFSKYGSYCEDGAERTIHVYQSHPKQLYTEEGITHNMSRADADIERLEYIIAMLKAYKIELVDRYNYIVTSPTREKIKLQRIKKTKVEYHIIFYTVNLVDGHETEKKRIKFSGTDRAAAIKEFEKLAKEHTNAITEKDISKNPWE